MKRRIQLNGTSSYQAIETIPYSPGEIYHVEVVVNLPESSYSATVTDEAGNTQVLATDFGFRTAMSNTKELDHIVGYSAIGGLILMDYSVEEFVSTESIDITEESISIEAGDTRTLTATVLPENATNKEIEWQSSETAFAAVDENGTVTGVSEGSAVITATVTGTTIDDVCIVNVTPAQEETSITIEAPESVVEGQEFTVEIGFDSTDTDMEVQCAEITVSYDTSLLEYSEYEEIVGGLSLIETDTDTPGEVGIIISGEGEGTAITDDVKLIKLTFEAKEDTGSGEINVTEAEFAVPVPGEEDPLLVEPTLSGITVDVLEYTILGDLNEDGAVNVLDLYYVSIHYGKTSASDAWGTAQIADVNNDGKVEIEDLVYVAMRILGQAE